MATEADIPAPVCEARGDQVGTIVDNIIKISVGQLSLEKQIQDDKHNELPIVEGENFLKPPSTVEVHCEATPDISKVIEEPNQTVREDMDALLLSTKDTSSDLNGTSDSYSEKSELTKEILQETSLLGEETESHTPCISESEELNVQLKTIDTESADQKPTEEDMSSDLTNKVASKQEGFKIEGGAEENPNASTEKVSHERIITPGETITKQEDEELKEAELSENEQSTRCTSVKEDKHIENHAESLHAASENIDVSDLSLENSVGRPEEQSRDVTLHGNTIEAEEAAINADDEHKDIPESLPPIVSSSHKEGSMNAVLEEDTSDHTDGKIVVEVDKHQEALESPSSGEAHCEVTYVSPDVSKGTENTDQTTKDGADTYFLSPKLADQPVESAANEGTSAEEILQHAEESNSADKDEEPEHHSKYSAVLTPEDDHDKDDTREVTQLPNETSSDHHCTNDSSTETVALTEEKLQEINLPSEQILSNAPCISEGEELNIPEKAADDKSVDEKPTEEDMSCNLTNGVSKEGGSDQNEMTSEQEGLQNDHHADGKTIDEVEKHPEVLETLSSGEAHSEVNNFSPDVSTDTENTDQTVKDCTGTLLLSPKFADQPVEFAADEEPSVEAIQRNAEESDITDKDVVPEQCINDSPVVASVIDDPEMDGAKMVTQLSKDTSSDHHGTNDSSRENVALTEEIIQETNLAKEETEADMACISEAEELNVQVKTTDNKHADEKPTEEDISSDLTNEVCEKEEVGQNKMSSEQEVLENERSIEDNFNTSADEASHEYSTSGETITTLETSNGDELQSKSGLNSSLSKEEETTVEVGDRSVTKSEDIGVPSGNTLSRGDVECQSKTLEDEEHKIAKVFESEQSPRCTSVKEDVQIENPAESLHVDLGNIEVPNSSQENKTEVLPVEESIDAADSQKDDHESFQPIVSGPFKEGNVNAVQQEAMTDRMDEKIIDEFDKHEEATENLSTTVSTEDAGGSSLSKSDHSENKREDDSVKECEEVPLPPPLAREVDVPTDLHEAQFEDEETEKAEVCDDERSTESTLLKTESKTENTEDEHVNFEHTKASDLVEKISEGGTVDATEEKEETLENVPAVVPNDKMEENSYIKVDDQKRENEEQLDKENEQLSSIANNDGGVVKDEEKIEDENPRGVEFFENNKNTESDEIEETAIEAANTNEKTQEQNDSNENRDKDLPIEVDASEMKHDTNLEEELERPSLTEPSKNDDKPAILPEPKTGNEKVELLADEKSTGCTAPEKESLQLEDHTASTSSADIETTRSLSDEFFDASDKELTFENVATEIPHEHTEENLVPQVGFTKTEQDEHLEKDNQDSSMPEALESKDIDGLKNRGEELIKPHLETGDNTETTSVKEETKVEKPIDSLQVKPEQQDSIPDINRSIEEQVSVIDPREISIDNTEKESFETAQTNEECVEIKDIAKDIPDCEKEDSIQIKEVGSPNPLTEASEGNANDDESTRITEDCLIKEAEPPKSLQLPAQDIETPPLSQDRELSSLDEHSPISYPEGITVDNKEDIADDATHLKDESPTDKDVVKSVPNGDSEDNSPTEADDLQKPSSEKKLAEKIHDDEPTTTHETKFTNEDAVQANLSENEEKIECAFVEEEVHVDSLHVADEDIKDSSSAQDREASHFEEQEPTTDFHGATGDQKDAETLDLTDPKEETLEDKDRETTPHKDTNEDSLQVDGSTLEEKEQPEKDSESSSITDAPEDDITERTLVREIAQVENPIDSSQVASEDTEVVAPYQDTERRSGMEQILVSEDISSNEVTEKITDATKEEIQEAQDLATSAPREDNSPNEQNIEAALTNEDLSTELPQVAVEDTEKPCLSEVSSQEEQILSASPGVVIKDNKENETINPTVIQKEIPEDAVLKEMESVDVKAAINEDEGCLKGVETTTADTIVASNQETSLSITAEKTPCAEDLNVNKNVTGDILEASNYKQQESSITEVFEEHTVISKEHESDSTSTEPEVSEKNNDQIVEEANSCGDKTDSEKIEVLNHSLTAVPASETLVTDPRGCTETEVEVPYEEKEAEVINQEAENDEKNIKETLPNDASEDVSESKEVNGEDEINSNNYKGLSSSLISVAPEEVSTSNVALEEDLTSTSSQEPRKETREEADTEEDQNQEPAPQVSELIQDSPVEKFEKDTHLSLGSADDSVVTEEMQELEENTIETTDCKESDVVEDATNHLEQDDVTNSFSDDKMPTEKEQETVANDILPASSSETPGVDHFPTEREQTNKEEPCTGNTATGDDEEKSGKGNDAEKEAREEKISDSMVTNEDTSLEGNHVDKTSITDLETENDEKALEIKETAPSSTIGQDAESASVQEPSYYAGSLAEEKSDSNEVATTPIENKRGHDSNNQGLEPIAQDQSCDINLKTEEEKLEADAEIQFDKAVKEDIPEDITHEKEIVKDDILSEKEQSPRVKEEDEDIQEYQQDSCADEVITDSHQEEEVNQDQQVNSKETDELTKYGDETETVAKVSAHVDDKAPEDLEDKEVASEAVERILNQKDQVTSVEEPTADIDDEKANELDIACAQTDTQDKGEEGVQIAVTPGSEGEEQNKKDEICSSDEVQAKDEEELILSEEKSEEEAKEAYVEAEKLDFASQTNELSECAINDGSQDIPEDNENSTTNKFSEEDYPKKSRECEVPSAEEVVAATEQSTVESVIAAEVQEAKAGIDLEDAVPEAAGLESREVEGFDDKFVEMADTSAPVENPVVSTSKIIPELTEGTPLEAEYNETKLHGLPEELNVKDSEVKMAERDDAVNLQSVRDISEECKESFEVSNHENPMEGDTEEKTETSEVQETEPILSAPVSETLKQETEEQQLVRRTEDVHEEEKIAYNIIPKQLESSYGAKTEKVPEPSIHHSSTEDTAQHENKEEIQQNPHCSDIKTSEKDLPVNVGGVSNDDASEQRDEHVVLEADDTKNLNTENLDGDGSKISSEISGGEHETVKPQKLEKEEKECKNEEGTNQEMKAKPEPEETSPMADHSPAGKEPASHTEDLQAEKTNEAEHETSKTDEEKDDEEESSREQEKSDLSSEAPVMVDMGDADVKVTVTPKKSHNILSGVGSKVKHSIAKVKKAITGKSSHPKTPSPSKVVD